MLRIIHKQGTKQVRKGRIPAWKDRAKIDEMKRLIIEDNNRKVLKAKKNDTL